MSKTAKPEPVERVKSPIWGQPAHKPADSRPSIVLQLVPTRSNYKPASEDSHHMPNPHLNVPPESPVRNISPYSSIIEQHIEPRNEKSVPTFRQRPEHSTYVYQRPLVPIREYPHLEEFATRGWVDRECRTKDRAVKEWEPEANTPANGNYYNRK
jgi:hypothetical protein